MSDSKNEDSYLDIPVETPQDPLEQKIFDVFSVYDFRNINMVDGADIENILGLLGCAASPEEVEEIVKETEFPTHPGEVHLSNFMPYLKNVVYEGKMKPAPFKEILEAFRKIDTANRGYINKDDFVNYMKTYGEEMSDEAMDKMIKAAVDPHEQRVYYEAYAKKLAHQPKDSIYELAKTYAKLRTNFEVPEIPNHKK